MRRCVHEFFNFWYMWQSLTLGLKMDSTIHVSLKQLIFLKHIRHLALDYHTRVLEEISKNRLPQTIVNRESVPDTLTQRKTTLFYKKRSGMLKFSRRNNHIETGHNNDKNLTAQRRHDEQDTETICGCIFVYMEDFDGRKDDLTEQQLNDLTDVLKQEIYSYVELTNKQLEKSKSAGADVSEKLILTGRAILNEILDEESGSESESCPDEVVANLDKLPFVHGFGFSKEGFCVLVVKQTEDVNLDLIKHIKCATTSWKYPKIVWLEEEPFHQYMHSGDRLVSETYKKVFETTGKKHGSIGVFGTTDKGQMVFTTAGHIFKGEGEKAYIVATGTAATASNVSQSRTSVSLSQPSRGNLKLIGTCMGYLGAGIENDADFTLVQVESAREDCKQRLHHPDYEVPLEKELYTKPSGTLQNKFVQTLRTELHSDGHVVTEYTDGIVVLDPFFFTGEDLQIRRRYIAITDTGNTERPFAMPGYSGAPVIKTEFINGRPVAKVVSSILYGPGGSVEQSSAKNERKQDSKDVYKECVYTWRMDEALAEEGEKMGIEVSIDTI